jgi:hypothetical protein
MRRREFVAGVCILAAWSAPAYTQNSGKVPRIGFLGLASPSTFAPRLGGLLQGCVISVMSTARQ